MRCRIDLKIIRITQTKHQAIPIPRLLKKASLLNDTRTEIMFFLIGICCCRSQVENVDAWVLSGYFEIVAERIPNSDLILMHGSALRNNETYQVALPIYHLLNGAV